MARRKNTKHFKEELKPPKHAVPCKFWDADKSCNRGTSCWFKHEEGGVVNRDFDDGRLLVPSESGDQDTDYREEDKFKPCDVCGEVPTMYALLSKCDHAFCVDCLRAWRRPAMHTPDVKRMKMHKSWLKFLTRCLSPILTL